MTVLSQENNLNFNYKNINDDSLIWYYNYYINIYN